MITDDHAIIERSITTALKNNSQLEVLAELGNGKKLIEFLKTNHRDIILLDIEMPVMNGIETLKIICQRFPEVKVIMLTMHSDQSIIYGFINLGVRGYLSKSCDEATLVTHILRYMK